MAVITSVETGRVVVGDCPIPPIASIEAWPSLDPQSIASFHNTGIHLGEGIQNQIGLYNGIGLQSITGLKSLIGFKNGVGGECNSQPSFDSSAIKQDLPAVSGNLWGKWKYNGRPIDTTSSDIKLKTNIKPLENSLEKVMKLRGVEYDRIDYGRHQIGMIAQEVEKVIPDLVTEDVEKIKHLEYGQFTAVLVEAIKEQQEQINSLKQTVQELSTKIAQCCSSC